VCGVELWLGGCKLWWMRKIAVGFHNISILMEVNFILSDPSLRIVIVNLAT